MLCCANSFVTLCGELCDVNSCVTVLYCVDSFMVFVTALQFYTVLTALWC